MNEYFLNFLTFTSLRISWSFGLFIWISFDKFLKGTYYVKKVAMALESTENSQIQWHNLILYHKMSKILTLSKTKIGQETRYWTDWSKQMLFFTVVYVKINLAFTMHSVFASISVIYEALESWISRPFLGWRYWK